MWNVLFLGLVNWMATTIAVESELFRPLREVISRRRTRSTGRVNTVLWSKCAYLVGCHLCTGTWVALVQAAIFGTPFHHGLAGVAAGGLLYKSIGHLVLELRPQAWASSREGS